MKPRAARRFVAPVLAVLSAFCIAETPHEKAFRNLSVSAPPLNHAPTLDGTVDPAEWAGAGIAPRMVLFEREDRLLDETGRFYFATTDDALWLAWQIQRPKEAIAPKAVVTRPDTSFFRMDDAIELMLNCRPHSKDRKAGRDFYMVWNAIGTKYDRREAFENEVAEWTGWNGDWKAVSRSVPDFGWEGEAQFPLATLEGSEKPGAGVRWRFQLVENRATPEPLVALLGFQGNWFDGRDYPTLLFTGHDGVFVRVLESGAMAETGQGGVILELVNPGNTARRVKPWLKFYKRKTASHSPLSYLRAFDQSRDRPEDLAGQGKTALFISDEQLSQNLLHENYDLIREQKDPLTLQPGERKRIDFVIEKSPGDYLALYEVRYAEGQAPQGESQLIAGGPLPFLFPESLAIRMRSLFLEAKVIDVRADLRYVNGWEGKGTITAKLVASDNEAQVFFEKQWPGHVKARELEFDLPIQSVHAGSYKLAVKVLGENEKPLAERSVDITIPQTPEWFRNPVGLNPVIPKPWRPIHVSQKDGRQSLSFLMGDYELTDSVLPAAIRVRAIFDEERQPILRAPVRLHGVVNGEEQEWHSSVEIKDQKDEKVTVASTATAAGTKLESKAEFEFDGVAKIFLSLAPQDKPVEMTELTLSIPLAKGFADLYNIQRPLIGVEKVKSLIGSLPPEGVHHEWRPHVWIGNTRRGLEWFAENWRGWRAAPENVTKVIEVENGADGATLHIHFIRMDKGKPLVLDKPREIVFGLMFTPPRAINPKAIRIGSGYYVKEHENRLATDVAAGVNTTEVWNHHDPKHWLQGWPDQTPEYTAQLAEWAKRLHEHGIQVTPYAGWGLSRNSEIYPTWGAEMVVEPLIDMGMTSDTVCWNTPFTDAWLYQMRKAARESGYDGFRLDSGFGLSPCSSLRHRGHGSVCGWRDDDGKLQPSLSIFGSREAAKRAYRMYHSQDITEDGLCLQAISGGVHFSPILSFMDGVVSSEGAEMMARTTKDFDISFWRSNVMEDRRGLQVIYGPKGDRLGYDTRMGFGLLHRLTPRGTIVSLYEQSYSRSATPVWSIWKAEDWVQWLDKGTEFFGYWENAQHLQTGHPELYGSFHLRRGEKVLLAVMNRERQPMEQAVRMDLKALGFKGKTYALDAIRNDPVEITDGQLTLDFTAESFRLVKIAAKPFDVVTPQKSSENLVPEIAPGAWTPGQTPAGWGVQEGGAFSIRNGEIVLTGKDELASLGRVVKLVPGKHYLFEMEVRLECANRVYLKDLADVHRHHVGISLGEYYGTRQTLGSQLLPGRYATLRVYHSPAVTDAYARLWMTGEGQAFIKSIGVYEVDRVNPPFLTGQSQ